MTVIRFCGRAMPLRSGPSAMRGFQRRRSRSAQPASETSSSNAASAPNSRVSQPTRAPPAPDLHRAVAARAASGSPRAGRCPAAAGRRVGERMEILPRRTIGRQQRACCSASAKKPALDSHQQRPGRQPLRSPAVARQRAEAGDGARQPTRCTGSARRSRPMRRRRCSRLTASVPALLPRPCRAAQMTPPGLDGSLRRGARPAGAPAGRGGSRVDRRAVAERSRRNRPSTALAQVETSSRGTLARAPVKGAGQRRRLQVRPGAARRRSARGRAPAGRPRPRPHRRRGRRPRRCNPCRRRRGCVSRSRCRPPRSPGRGIDRPRPRPVEYQRATPPRAGGIHRAVHARRAGDEVATQQVRAGEAHLAGGVEAFGLRRSPPTSRPSAIGLRRAGSEASLRAHGQPRGVEVALDARLLLQAHFAGDIAPALSDRSCAMRRRSASNPAARNPGQRAAHLRAVEQRRGVEYAAEEPRAGGHLAFAEIDRPSIQAPSSWMRGSGGARRSAAPARRGRRPARHSRAAPRAMAQSDARDVAVPAGAQQHRSAGRSGSKRAGWSAGSVARLAVIGRRSRNFFGAGPTPARWIWIFGMFRVRRIVVRWRGFWNSGLLRVGAASPTITGRRPLSRPSPDVRAATTRRARAT